MKQLRRNQYPPHLSIPLTPPTAKAVVILPLPDRHIKSTRRQVCRRMPDEHA